MVRDFLLCHSVMLPVLQAVYLTFNLYLLRTADRYPDEADFAGPLISKHYECDASETTLLSREHPTHSCQDQCVVQVTDRQ